MNMRKKECGKVGKRKKENGKRKMVKEIMETWILVTCENGTWEMESGKWKVEMWKSGNVNLRHVSCY